MSRNMSRNMSRWNGGMFISSVKSAPVLTRTLLVPSFTKKRRKKKKRQKERGKFHTMWGILINSGTFQLACVTGPNLRQWSQSLAKWQEVDSWPFSSLRACEVPIRGFFAFRYAEDLACVRRVKKTISIELLVNVRSNWDSHSVQCLKKQKQRRNWLKRDCHNNVHVTQQVFPDYTPTYRFILAKIN